MNYKRCFCALCFVLMTVTCSSSWAVVTGQYLFENNTNDTSGFARNGTAVNGPTFVPGLYFGSTAAMRFNSDGTTANQALAQTVTLPPSSNFITNAPGATLAAWVRLDAGGTGNRTVISVNNGDAATGGGLGASRATLQIDATSGQWRALGRKDDAGGSSSVLGGTPVVGRTYFIAGVFDYLGGGIRTYVNGVQSGSTTIAAWNTNSANTANLVGAIGGNALNNAEYWPGVIDGARVYDTVLSAQQLLDIFNAETLIKAGDTNGDGIIDIATDLKAIRDHYLQTVNSRALGDLDDNQLVNFADFRQWKTAFLGGGGSLDGVNLSFSSVPEPSAMLLLFAAIVGLTAGMNRVRLAPLGPVARPCRAAQVAIGAAAILFTGNSIARATVTLSGDPAYPANAAVFTVDPEGKTTANRGITAVRNLRQTFQVPTAFDVGAMVVALNVDAAATTSGLQVRFYEVEDVLGAWAPGNLVKQFIFASVPGTLPAASTIRTGFSFTGTDVFTLPARATGAQGYGIEFSNNDGVGTVGSLRFNNDGIEYYTAGRYYTETGPSSTTRDVGLALAAATGGGLVDGDVDGDGDIDLDDLSAIASHFRQNVATRSLGDLTGDGLVDLSDFRDWKTHYSGAGAGADYSFLGGVPEPGALALVLSTLLTLGAAVRSRTRAAPIAP